jgi:rfaE bifunctional protein nucleotidyltransferase chain/domain
MNSKDIYSDPKKLEECIRLNGGFHDQKIVVNGCFDLLHCGHLDLLQKAKNLLGMSYPLFVAINSDESVSRLKPGRPIINQWDRLRMLNALQVTDKCFIFDSEDFAPYLAALGKCWFVKGGDYSRPSESERKVLCETESNFVTVDSRLDNPTSKIIEKIKMGAHTTLNITRSKAKELLVQKILGEISDEELGDFMDDLLYDRLYNANIVPDHFEENDDDMI